MLRFGLIGCGRFGRHYLTNLFSIAGASVTILCTRNQPSDQGRHVKYEPDYTKVCTSKEVDCVIVATPPHLHYEICKAALLADKHVICEKPFVLQTRQGEELALLAQSRQLNLIVNYIHLFNPAFQDLCKHYDAHDPSIKYVESEGLAWGPFRDDCTVAWDWLSHDIAMLFHVFGTQFEVSNVCQQDPTNPYKSTVSVSLLGANNVLAMVHCGNTSFHKRRHFSLKSERQALSFVDDLKFNPLKLMLEEFILKTTACIPHRNAHLACAVTGFLERLVQVRVQGQWLRPSAAS